MVLHPLDTPPAIASAPLPAWAAVAERQKYRAKMYWLIRQPDHARLAGELAANFRSPDFPAIDAVVARAIGAHDAGWGIFAPEASCTEAPMTNHEGKPLAFIEFEAEQFLRAWTGSIEKAASICAAGGIIVSRHFCELGSLRLKNGGLSEQDRRRVRDFELREASRQAKLLPECPYSEQELDGLLETLKFCDLLSLYLCSGARNEAEFPEKLTSCPVRVRRDGDVYRLYPSPFQDGKAERVVSLCVPACHFPLNDEPATTLRFRLV